MRIHDLIPIVQDAISKRDELGALSGIPSGFSTLDEITGGWRSDGLTVIAAKPVCGKDIFALNVARNAAVEWGIPTAFFSLHDSAATVTERLIIAEFGIDFDSFDFSNQLSSIDSEAMNATLARLKGSPLFIENPWHLTVENFIRKIKELKHESGISLVIVDYIQLMRLVERQPVTTRREMSMTLDKLAAISSELHIPIIITSQIDNDSPDSLRLISSEAVENHVGLVITIDGNYDGYCFGSHATLHVVRNRYGKLGDIEMGFSAYNRNFFELNPFECNHNE